jgi:CRISPR-associated protein Csb1
LRGKDTDETKQIQKYLLSLALLVATKEIELSLREGCLLRYADEEDVWAEVPRRGNQTEITDFPSHADLVKLANEAVEPFRSKWPMEKDKDGEEKPVPLEHAFNLAAAKKLLAKKGEEVTP